ncbi:hypothetical protein E0H26_19155 [Micromonospora zingiberis]|uniref:Uncharacterized protein n=1 Tax=Micromonospora zingiberis TaxID=2053011 RepID=A0A4R0GGX8_9ACTN|nr:hypothetical protein [Micromonospora zingiberis]TCB95582.1 hypothetical protein E0H26_19155 [Micromonospora zingiberis]
MIKPELPEYIRTMVRGDYAANDAVEAKLDAEGWDGLPRYLAAVFFLAVDRRFGETGSHAEIIAFVGELRAGLADGGPEINAEAAEQLISSIIDPSLDYSMSQEMIGRIQAATVQKILTEENLSDSELDSLLAEAANLSSRPDR